MISQYSMPCRKFLKLQQGVKHFGQTSRDVQPRLMPFRNEVVQYWRRWFADFILISLTSIESEGTCIAQRPTIALSCIATVLVALVGMLV